MLPNDVRYTDENRHVQELQQWRLGPLPCTLHNAAYRNGGDASEVESENWRTMVSGSDPRQGRKTGHFGFLASEGPHPLNEISLLNGKVLLTREGVQAKERNNMVSPNVWTKVK